MDRTILHIDFDSFFASVEQQYRPELRHRPIGVTATNGRTCIIAASREAKKTGITSPSNTYKARQLCPGLILTKAHFQLYWEVSKKFISICKDFSPLVEVFSIDELFMDITSSAHLFGGTQGVIEKIKERIRLEIGEYITVSIGVSHNKLLAKLASGLKKPNGIMSIPPENVALVYTSLPLTKICGIGERIKQRLNSLGIYTLIQLSHAPLSSLVAEFGPVEGTFLKNVGLGVDLSPVVAYTDPSDVKSVSRNYCLPENEFSDRVALQNVYELCEEIGIKLRRLHKKARRLGLSLGGSHTVSVQRTSSRYFDTGKDIFDFLYALLVIPESGWHSIPEEFRYVRRISVWAGMLEESSTVPLELFGESGKWDTLMTVVDRMNDKFGDHTIRNGFLLYANKLTTVPNGYGPDTVEKEKLWKVGV